MKRKRGILTAVIIIILIVAAALLLISSKFRKMEREMNALENVSIDMNQVKDGTYTASSETEMIKVTLSVTVKDHAIEKIDLIKHECGKGKPAEAMLDEMVKSNTYEVDTVSGATASSKVIQNAVNKALQQGLEE